jgi:hypothetical protein
MKLRIAILVFGLIIISIGEVYGADWKLYYFDEKKSYLYDAQSITRPSKNIVRVWIRWDYTEKGVMGTVGKFGKKYENLDHLKYLCEINCVEKMIRYLLAAYYDNKRKVIHSLSSSPERHFIIPESMGENLYKEICK